jgi:fermentation-respiration switch protein FrsA (DUF1100 family)
MRGTVTVLVSILIAAAGLYGLVVVAMYVLQPRLLFLPEIPSRSVEVDPGAIGLAFEPVTIRTDDDVALKGWYVPSDPSRGVVLFFHGNAGNISHRLDSLRIFHRLGLSVFIFDYRGYGRSEGSPSEAGTQNDARAAWRYITDTRAVPASEVVLFGRSLGAAIAAWLAGQYRPGALIVESTFTSVPDMASELYWWLPARHLARFQYATRDYLKATMCPVLVVHSPNDEIIPFHHAEALYAAAHEPKELLRLSGSHNEGFLLSGAAYTRGLDQFLATHVGHASRHPSH